MLTSLVLAALLLVACAAAPAAPAPLEDFERPSAAWEFHDGGEFPGAKGAFARSAGAARSGRWGGALRFDFTGGGNYVQTGRELPRGMPAGAARLWVRNASGNRLGLRVTDSEGQTFQKTFDIDSPGWQEVDAHFGGWTGNWGGQGDGVFRGAATRLALLVENSGQAARGEVHIDDLRLTPGDAQPGGPRWYVATRFGAPQRWWIVAHGPGSRAALEGGELRYEVGPGDSLAGVGADFTLYGRPTRLRLTVQSDGSGRELVVRVGSHFQNFESRIGRLTERGEQTFETEMGAMAGWRHFGGQNDGVMRTPLRLTLVGVAPGAAGPGSGSIRLTELSVQTVVPPAQEVALTPWARLEGGIVRFGCDINSLLPEPVRGSAEWEARDWSGVVVARGSSPLALAQGAMASITGQTPAAGRPFTEITFRFRAGVRVFGPVTATAVATMADAGDARLEPASPWGMGLYLERFPDTPEGHAAMERAAALARAAGVKWTRMEMLWHRIEPERGRFDWSFYDRVVETALRNGISIYGLITYWSRWTRPYTPEGIADYARYCHALVTRYGDRIKHWEIWNEPNIFFWTGPREMYADLLKAAYAAIKEADPEAVVLGCSTAGIDTAFIRQVMDAGAPFDVLTIHPYRGHFAEESFMRELRDVAALTARGGGAPKPVWITEMGWPTQLIDGVTEREQAGLLARSYLAAVASGASQNVSWYNFREDGENPYFNEHRFGIVRHADLAPKPAYRALATVCRTIGARPLAGRIDLGAGLFAFRFSGSEDDVIAIWSADTSRVVGLRVESDGPVEALSLMGESSRLVVRDGVAAVAIPANSPVLLRARRLRVRSAPSPAVIDAPRAARSGEPFRLRLRLSGAMSGASVAVEAPSGWTKRRAGAAGNYDLTPPALDALHLADIVARVTARGGQRLTLPVRVRVFPRLLRV
ncbi:MAG TPA: beta-galactosidase [Chthonomonadales bacterium]|nr:beta-galactosidase [Chthonomonadales bacterium]